MCFAGAVSHLADQRHGHYPHDSVFLSDAGKSGYSSGRTDRAENIHAVLKSQVNPHFLYNTLDIIRIQAQLNGDNKVAELLMRLVDFFRLSVKVDRPMVSLDDEMLRDYAKQPPKLTGNSIGIQNVQKRIKLLCGREFGLWYTENDSGGVTVHILLPMEEKMR